MTTKNSKPRVYKENGVWWAGWPEKYCATLGWNSWEQAIKDALRLQTRPT